MKVRSSEENLPTLRNLRKRGKRKAITAAKIWNRKADVNENSRRPRGGAFIVPKNRKNMGREMIGNE
jgi:hypothetical protein